MRVDSIPALMRWGAQPLSSVCHSSSWWSLCSRDSFSTIPKLLIPHLYSPWYCQQSGKELLFTFTFSAQGTTKSFLTQFRGKAQLPFSTRTSSTSCTRNTSCNYFNLDTYELVGTEVLTLSLFQYNLLIVALFKCYRHFHMSHIVESLWNPILAWMGEAIFNAQLYAYNIITLELTNQSDKNSNSCKVIRAAFYLHNPSKTKSCCIMR